MQFNVIHRDKCHYQSFFYNFEVIIIIITRDLYRATESNMTLFRDESTFYIEQMNAGFSGLELDFRHPNTQY